MENEPMSVIEALNQIQSWLNAGEYDKVIQGCQEILQIEPSNSRAVALMRQAEERRHETHQAPDPLTSLEVEEPEDSELFLPEEEDHHEKKRLALAMLLPALVVVLLGGSLLWWLTTKDKEDQIEDAISEEEYNYLEANDERLEKLNQMIEVIEDYKREEGHYPSVEQIEEVLAQSKMENIPVDPRQGEIDKAGKAFGYMYAVYDGIGGENSVYIISALFEDDEGFGTPWAKGAPIKNYPDYRDYKATHVTFIGGSEDDVEIPGKGPKETESHGPKVNPDN